MEYIPGTLIRKRKPEEWEALLFEAHEGVDSDHPELDYIAVCKELEYYGCALFPVKVCAAAGCLCCRVAPGHRSRCVFPLPCHSKCTTKSCSAA